MSQKIAILMLSGLFSFSCAPKDEKLIRPDQNSNFKAEAMTIEDSAKLSFVAFDKEVEALYILKVILNSEYAASKNIKVEVISQTADSKVVRISAATVSNEDSNLRQMMKIALLATISSDVQGVTQSVLIKDDSNGQDIQELRFKDKSRLVTEGNPNLALTTKSKIISIVKVAGENTYVVSAESVETLRTFNKKYPKEFYNDISSVQVKGRIVWDGQVASLDQEINLISIDELNHLKTAQSKSDVRMKSVGTESISIKLGDCTSVNGVMNLATVPAKGNEASEKIVLQFTDSSIAVGGKSVSFKAAECAHRPIVDLRKFL